MPKINIWNIYICIKSTYEITKIRRTVTKVVYLLKKANFFVISNIS